MRFLPGCAALLLLAGCATTASLDADRAELLRLHEQECTAHLTYDADLLVTLFNEPLINVSDGAVSRPTREESRQRFQRYFDQVTFIEWDNIDPPIIRISSDGTMAYIIVHKRVRLTFENEDGETEEGHTVFAWMETWEKLDGTWTLMAIASTDRPGEE